MMADDPFALFETWYAEAREAELNDSNAMTVSSVGADGQPSSRMVLLKGHDARGFVFYTNLQSRKARELIDRPKAALLFHWKSLRRQVRIEGPVDEVSQDEANAYFATRGRDSQLGAWASDQSQDLESLAPWLYGMQLVFLGLSFLFTWRVLVRWVGEPPALSEIPPPLLHPVAGLRRPGTKNLAAVAEELHVVVAGPPHRMPAQERRSADARPPDGRTSLSDLPWT